MQEISPILLLFSGFVFLMSVVLVVMKRTRQKAIFLFAGSAFLLAATIRLGAAHDIKGYLLLSFPGGALIIASAVLGLVSHYKSSKASTA